MDATEYVRLLFTYKVNLAQKPTSTPCGKEILFYAKQQFRKKLDYFFVFLRYSFKKSIDTYHIKIVANFVYKTLLSVLSPFQATSAIPLELLKRYCKAYSTEYRI